MENKVALVTGAGRSIGKASAITLLQNGWPTVFVGRKIEPLSSANAEAGRVNSQSLAL